MKKFLLALVLILGILIANVVTFADVIDLSPYDDDSLIEILQQVQQEMADRNIEKTAELMAGTYIGGKDIPVGTYLYTCKATGNDWGNVTIYTLDSNGKHDDRLFWKVVDAPDEGKEEEVFLITLNEGDELSSGVPFTLTIYAGVQFK